jgi:UDP-2-acetamido-2,6-beta-L-arabino-hexul-4-ose reductase
MIIGNGMIASEFNLKSENYLNCIIFASGVSDSNETNENEFNREKFLIIKTINENRNLKLIYFSCVLVETIKNDYYNAKLKIEELVKNEASDYIIFRLPQIIGNNGNPSNLANFLWHSINNNLEITIYNDVERALVDVKDLVSVVNYCKDRINRETLNFSGIEKLKVITICNLIGNILNKRPILKIVDGISGDNNWNTKNSNIINEAIIKIDSNGYTNKVLKKYMKNESNCISI